MSVLNSGWSHQGESLTAQEPGPPANLDSDPGHLPGEDPQETSAQESISTAPSIHDPDILGQGLPDLDTSWASDWPELRTLLQQLPPQDSDWNLFLQERYCQALGEEELAELRLFCAQRRREALGQGVAYLVPPKLKECTCEKCRQRLRPGEYGVFAARAGEQRCWHRACFACQACGQALINLIYFYHDGHLYCGRHHAELLRPRCPACDQLIFSRLCTEAEGRRWHESHFCCEDCAGPLKGGRYALQGGGPCCLSCFQSRYLDVSSSPAATLERRPSLGEVGLDSVEGGDHRVPRHSETTSGAAVAAAASSSREVSIGRFGTNPEQECGARDKAEASNAGEQSPLVTPIDPTEDAPCPTCSSSSDSEPEGFFLGQRLPGPCKTPGRLQPGGSDTSRKHCTIC